MRLPTKVARPEQPRRIIITLGIGIAISMLGDNTLYTVLPKPEIAAEAGVTLAMVGILLGINRLVRLIFNGTAGALYDRLPRRGLLIGSLCMGAISTLIFALSRGFTPLLIARILWGAAWSGLWIGGNTVVLDIANDHNRGRLTSQYQAWFFIGVGTCGVLGGLFTDIFGFHGGLLVSSGITVLVVLMWLIFLPETRPSSSVSDLPTQIQNIKSFPWHAALPASITIFAVRFVHAGVLASTTILWLSSFIGERYSLSWLEIPIATLTGLLVAGRSAISVVGAPITGFISDRLGHRWGLMSAALIMGAIGTWLMGGTTLGIALIGVLIASITSGGTQSLAPAIAGDHIGIEYRSRVLSVMYTFGDLASALGPPIALSLISVMPISSIYRMCAILFVLAALYASWRSAIETRSRSVDRKTSDDVSFSS
jgi:DHA1 family multidrug resistance protein-like MFS transporter